MLTRSRPIIPGEFVHRYQVHGLILQSEFPFPHAAPDPGREAVVVQIRHGAYPDAGDAIRVGDWLSGTQQALQFRIPEVGTFACVGGREIWVAPEPNASPVKIELFALGTALGIIHYQRGDFPVHGAFIADGNRAYGFCGASGEGKSTVGLALAHSGNALLTDDVAIIRLAEGEPRVYAENTHLKLWENSIRNFALPIEEHARLDERHAKYYVPLPMRAPASPPRLNALVFLESGPPGSELLIEPLKHLPALAALREHTYRSFLINALGLDRQHLAFGASLLKQVRMIRFRRPRSLDRLEEGVERLMREVIHADR